MKSGEPLAEVQDLRISFPSPQGYKEVVHGLDLTLYKGEVFAFVGESGSGKTVTGYAFMGLLPSYVRVEGRLHFLGRNLIGLPPRQWHSIRGEEISMIFQEPMISLNPTMKVGQQVAEVFMLHQGMDKKEALGQTVAILGEMGIPQPEIRVQDYPHQMSGGMRQRILIAMAMAARPKLLIADEPTTALDVTVQAQILALLKRLQRERGTTIFFITHDLGIVAEVAHRVGVIKGGLLLEESKVDDLYDEPLHPYTWALLEVLPHWERHGKDFPLPQVREEGEGACPFYPFCGDAKEACHNRLPPIKVLGERKVRCWLY